MSEKFVGVTLLFAAKRKDELEGWMHSHVVGYRDRRSARIDALTESEAVGRRTIERWRSDGWDNIDYLGVHDLFCVVGPIRHGALLGRTTLWECRRAREVTRLVAKPDKLSFRGRSGGPWYLASPLYFVEDPQDETDSFAISCHALIEAKDPGTVQARAETVAQSHEFREKIRRCDAGNLINTTLTFAGFEDIEVIAEDVTRGGAFQRLVRSISTVGEIKDMVEDEDEVREFFDNATCL